MKSGRVRLVLRTSNGTEEITVVSGPRGCVVELGGAVTAVDPVRLPDGRLSLLLDDGRQVCGRVTFVDGDALVATAGGTVRVRIEDPLRHPHRHGAAESDEGGEEVKALMPGRIIEVPVAEGDVVGAGDILLVIEAMKMQNEIRASRGGVVTRIAVKPGLAVDSGALMVTIGPRPDPPLPGSDPCQLPSGREGREVSRRRP